MTTSSTSAPQNARPDGESDDHQVACRASVSTLRRVLDQLYPDGPNPDILTVEDVIRRYPLTQLGGPATAAMEQSRRIARTRRDFTQMALAEFHAGLIYLYWSDGRAAAQQFAAARTQWSLAGNIPPVCLAHFAQGLALQHSYNFEAAMSQFGWAERCLTRNQSGANARRVGELGSELWPLLEAAQQAIRPNLWPQEEQAPHTPLPNSTHAVPVAAPQPTQESTGSSKPVAELNLRPRQPTDGIVGAPISNMRLERRDTSPDTGEEVLPGHTLYDPRYRWFAVYARRDGWLPELTEGTKVLIDTEFAPLAAGMDEELALFFSPTKDVGSVIVRPDKDMTDTAHLFLGYRSHTSSADGPDADDADDADANETESDSKIRLDESNQKMTIPDAVILGIVVGFWHKVLS